MFSFPIDEIKRKSFHLLSLLYIMGYWFLPLPAVLWALGAFLGVVLIGEVVRLRVPAFNERLLAVLGGVHRDHETAKVSGLPWTISGSLLTMTLFPDKAIVTASLLYLALGDAAAALAGKRFGKRKILKEKTLEGTLACFAVCFAVGLFFLSWPLALAGATAAALIELVPWPLNDNFWMPLISSGFLTAAASFL